MVLESLSSFFPPPVAFKCLASRNGEVVYDGAEKKFPARNVRAYFFLLCTCLAQSEAPAILDADKVR